MFGKTITELRKERSLSCSELARRCGRPVSSIHNIETGVNQNPGFEIICDIADALGVSVDELKQEFRKGKEE